MFTLLFRPGAIQRWLAVFALLAGCSLPLDAIAAWQWSAASTIKNLSVSGQNALLPQVAANRKGNAVAVWSRSDGVNTVIQAAPYQDKAWGTAVTISPAVGIAASPRVAVSGNGIAQAVWIRAIAGNPVVESAGCNLAGNVWTDAVRVSDLGWDAAAPQIAMNEDGVTALVWTRYNGTVWVVQAKLYVNGVWQDTVNLSTPLRDAFTPQAVVSSSGAVTVVWSRFDGAANANIIESVRYEKGRWSDAVMVSDPVRDTRFPQLAVDEAGNVTVVWTQANGQLFNIQSRRWLAATGWDANIIALSPVTQMADTPAVTADSKGTAIAVWSQLQADGLWSIRSRRFSNGSWADANSFAPGGQSAYTPQIAADNSGSATAAWMRSDGVNTVIRGTHFRNGEWTPVTALSVSGQNAVSPQVAMPGGDSATVVWLRSNGSNTIVQARQGAYITPTYTVTLNKSGTGTVTSDPAGIDCGKICTASYLDGVQVTLTATPAEGFNFQGWSGACTGSAACVLKMTVDQTVNAKFVASMAYALKITAPASTCPPSPYWLCPPPGPLPGVVTSSPEGINCGERNKACKFAFGKDAVVTLTATPKYGYYFKNWVGCPTPDGPVCTVTVTQPTTTVTPRFAALPKYALKISKTRFGSVTSEPAGLDCKTNARSCQRRFVVDTPVTLTAQPAPDRRFVGWGGDCSGAALACTVIMNAKKKVSATFE